jgi:transcriptional regulator with XRE-family HTH domain
MQTDKRFFDNLLADKGVSLRQLAQRMGMNHSQLSLTFSGARRMQLDEAVRLARYFGIPLQRVVQAAGVDGAVSAGRLCNVTGIMRGDGKVLPPDAIEKALTPDGMPDDIEAIQARTANSPLAWVDSWVFFFQPLQKPDSSLMGRFCVVRTERGMMVATVRRGYSDGGFALSGLVDLDSVGILAASPVLHIRP